MVTVGNKEFFICDGKEYSRTTGKLAWWQLHENDPSHCATYRRFDIPKVEELGTKYVTMQSKFRISEQDELNQSLCTYYRKIWYDQKKRCAFSMAGANGHYHVLRMLVKQGAKGYQKKLWYQIIDRMSKQNNETHFHFLDATDKG